LVRESEDPIKLPTDARETQVLANERKWLIQINGGRFLEPRNDLQKPGGPLAPPYLR
jgi:hypothetical protein